VDFDGEVNEAHLCQLIGSGRDAFVVSAPRIGFPFRRSVFALHVFRFHDF
jgi:hypothetical protein